MTDFTQALVDLQWLGKRLKGIVEIAPELESYTQLQNNVRELTSTREKLSKEIEKSLEDVSAAKAEAKKISEDAKNEKKKSEAALKERSEKADAEAAAILAKAKESAADVVAAANDEATKIKEHTKTLFSSVEKLEKEILAKNAVLKSIEDKIAELKAKLG